MTDEELLRHLLDLATASMDYGSGFMDDEDVETLRAAAARLGVDPWEVTPENHRPKYCPGHEWGEWQDSTWLRVYEQFRKCALCNGREWRPKEGYVYGQLPPNPNATYVTTYYAPASVGALPDTLNLPQPPVDTSDDEVV